MPPPPQPTPRDVVGAAMALQSLASVPSDSDLWSATAAPTLWTAARTIEHIGDALLFYSGQVARRAEGALPTLRDGRAAPAAEHLDNALSAACVLAGLLKDLGSHRAFHPSGMADADGWAGMAITEILVHGTDAARAMGASLELPEDICARTVARVFPWVDPALAGPAELLLAVTGRAAVPGIDADPDWWWQSAPLHEWDGRPARRNVAPGWR